MTGSNAIPAIRLTVARPGPIRAGTYVLYWMHASRRTTWNFALQQAVRQAEELGLPLLVFEPLRCDYRWASARHHRFVVDGMATNAALLAETNAFYFPYVEPAVGAGKGLLRRLAADAAVVVTDDNPTFFLRRMVAAAAEQIDCRLELVDSNGLLPLRQPDRTFKTAHAFRRYLQNELHDHLDEFPQPAPVADVELPRLSALPDDLVERWSPTPLASLQTPEEMIAGLPVDQSVAAVARVAGGSLAAREMLDHFLAKELSGYLGDRNQLDRTSTSGLSAHLHHGHISTHQIVDALARHEGLDHLDPEPAGRGARTGWWNVSESAESFLDQLVTWRELGFNMCHRDPDYESFTSLPDWAQQTLFEHGGDARPYLYSLEQLERGATHDSLWNAAQNQLRREGRIHNYLRMLWGKKILEWTASPEIALATMIELNNKYALDGRDPNSTSGICWVLGRYDRAWGPERKVYGKVRYMTSENTARKMRVKNYIRRHGGEAHATAD
jgi:deoxyribodipyrimidine photo-lyase